MLNNIPHTPTRYTKYNRVEGLKSFTRTTQEKFGIGQIL